MGKTAGLMSADVITNQKDEYIFRKKDYMYTNNLIIRDNCQSLINERSTTAVTRKDVHCSFEKMFHAQCSYAAASRMRKYSSANDFEYHPLTRHELNIASIHIANIGPKILEFDMSSVPSSL